ncbi:MAG: alpha/beta hydrolase, partial [Xanthobacter sp. 17-67-6]
MTTPGAEILSHLDVNGRTIAVRRLPGQVPGVMWLGGFKSDMMGSKAQ